ncbi:unnamed protein product [Polarella glacialis]|uniref:C3H1-type domain-containing protein n=1 Tax=Polarella glacialis TaxID=89957 RepID=A0A813GR11_POLGL|nr:unnamed protein product [Polarella glacialis]
MAYAPTAQLAFHGQGSGEGGGKRKRKQACWYYEHACCEKGSACPFSHEGMPGSKGVVDLPASETCWFFEKGACTKGLRCPFPHAASADKMDFQTRILSEQQQSVDMYGMPGMPGMPGMAGMAGFAAGFGGGMMMTNDGTFGQEAMKVPHQMARNIIGPGGENVKLLSTVTGCRVTLDSTPDASGMQNAILRGSAQQRARAKALIEEQCEAEDRVKKLRFQQAEPEDDIIYTAVKIALGAANMEGSEEANDVIKIRTKITQLARASADGLDVTGHGPPLEELVREIISNFFGSACPAYYERPWLASVDFMLVLEDTIRELVPEQVLSSVEAAELDRWVFEAHDLAFEEQRFVPFMWEIVKPLVDGPKTKKKAYKAIESGRSKAMSGEEEGSGGQRVENFVRSWVAGSVAWLAEEGGGDPGAILDKEKLVELFLALLAGRQPGVINPSIPARLAAEACTPEGGWQPLLESAMQAAWQEAEQARKAQSSGAQFAQKGKKGSFAKGSARPETGKGKMVLPRYPTAGTSKGYGGPPPAEEAWQPPRQPVEESWEGPSSAFVRARGSYGSSYGR